MLVPVCIPDSLTKYGPQVILQEICFAERIFTAPNHREEVLGSPTALQSWRFCFVFS